MGNEIAAIAFLREDVNRNDNGENKQQNNIGSSYRENKFSVNNIFERTRQAYNPGMNFGSGFLPMLPPRQVYNPGIGVNPIRFLPIFNPGHAYNPGMGDIGHGFGIDPALIELIRRRGFIVPPFGPQPPQGPQQPVRPQPPVRPQQPVRPQPPQEPQPREVEEQNYELGDRVQNTRIIDVDNLTIKNVKHPTTHDRDASYSDRVETELNITHGNGKIDDFKQGQRGDCYLLAAIDAIRGTRDGQQILNEHITKNPDGSWTVKLPGAIKVREGYEDGSLDMENGCAITGEYKITPEAIKKVQELSGKTYAFGDLEVIAYELAVEAYRGELLETKQNLGEVNRDAIYSPLYSNPGEDDLLNGGITYDATFLITGQKSEVFERPANQQQNIKLYTQGEYGYVGEDKPYNIGHGYKLANVNHPNIEEISKRYNKNSDFQKMLDKYAGNEDEFALTASVVVSKDGPDGTTVAGGRHAITVKKITENYVEITNPWNTKKRERIPRADFERMAQRFVASPVDRNYNNESSMNPFQNSFA